MTAYDNYQRRPKTRPESYINTQRAGGIETRTPTSYRTPEQIMAQLEARLAEMERDAAKPERVFPCSACRWLDGRTRCKQPLVIGLGTWELNAEYGGEWRHAKLCGPEKALWEPRRTILQRIADWIAK